MTALQTAEPRWPAKPPLPSAFAVTIRRVEGTVVVTVEGEVAGSDCAVLERLLTDLVAGQGNLDVVVDMHRSHYVDFRAWSILRVSDDEARRHGGRLHFCGPA